MNGETKRYVVAAQGPDHDAVNKALGLALYLVKNGEVETKKITLLVHTKDALNHSVISDVIGSEAAKALLKKRPVPLGHAELAAETVRTASSFHGPDIVIACYPDQRMLDIIDKWDSVKAVIVLPWSMDDEVASWIRTWGPQIFKNGTLEQTKPANLIGSPVVETALEFITHRVNLSTGLSHPSDKEAAISLFRQLYASGERWDAQSIREWALQNNWGPKGADDLSDIAQKIMDRRKIRGPKHSVWADDILEQIRSAADEKGKS